MGHWKKISAGGGGYAALLEIPFGSQPMGNSSSQWLNLYCHLKKRQYDYSLSLIKSGAVIGKILRNNNNSKLERRLQNWVCKNIFKISSMLTHMTFWVLCLCDFGFSVSCWYDLSTNF
jgi:hypothetical protein